MIFHENRLQTILIKYTYFCQKLRKMSQNLSSAAVMIGALRVKECNLKIIFLVLNTNIFCCYSIEPSQGRGSFEHPKHMFELHDKKIIAIVSLPGPLKRPIKNGQNKGLNDKW